MSNDRVLIFVHIPKTAGTTFRQIIGRQFPPEAHHTLLDETDNVAVFRSLPQAEAKKIRMILGHQKFGIHADLGVCADYITMLRDPIERVISHYYWIRSNLSNDLNPEVVKMRFEDFVASGLPHASNQQTEFTSGLNGPQNAETLEVARNNLAFHFKAFGIVEYFDQSLLLFRKALGWRKIYYFDRNVTNARPKKDDFPETTIELIRKHNGPDLELYEFAKNKFEELMAQEGGSFRRRLQMFRLGNRLYRKFAMDPEAEES